MIQHSVIDFHHAITKKYISTKLRNVLQTQNWFYLVNHGLSHEELNYSKSLIMKFFDSITMEEKIISSENNSWNKFILPTETFKIESLTIGDPDNSPNPNLDPEYYEKHAKYYETFNYPRPDDALTLEAKSHMDNTYRHFYHVSSTILPLIIKAFEGNPDFKSSGGKRENESGEKSENAITLRTALSSPWQISNLDANYYPPGVGALGLNGESEIPLFSHFDSNLFTILSPDENGGLEYTLNDDEWFEFPIIEGGLICFFGESARILMGDRITPLRHRVTPKEIYQECPRFSFQFQTLPRGDFILDPSSVGLGKINKSAMTYHEFLTEWNEGYDFHTK